MVAGIAPVGRFRTASKPTQVNTFELPANVDIATATALRETLLARLQNREPLAVSGAGVRHADTAGLQLLLSFFAEAYTSGVDVCLVEPSESLRESARLLGLSEHIDAVCGLAGTP